MLLLVFSPGDHALPLCYMLLSWHGRSDSHIWHLKMQQQCVLLIRCYSPIWSLISFIYLDIPLNKTISVTEVVFQLRYSKWPLCVTVKQYFGLLLLAYSHKVFFLCLLMWCMAAVLHRCLWWAEQICWTLTWVSEIETPVASNKSIIVAKVVTWSSAPPWGQES